MSHVEVGVQNTWRHNSRVSAAQRLRCSCLQISLPFFVQNHSNRISLTLPFEIVKRWYLVAKLLREVWMNLASNVESASTRSEQISLSFCSNKNYVLTPNLGEDGDSRQSPIRASSPTSASYCGIKKNQSKGIYKSWFAQTQLG